jgi:tetratricopeptide (TPR) repeat protein
MRKRNPSSSADKPVGRTHISRSAAIVIGAVSILAATGALVTSAQIILRERAPDFAVRFFADPDASLILLEREIGRDPSAVGSTSALNTIVAALREDPTSPRGLQLLALHAASRGHVARAMKLAELAEGLSRRELTVQLLLMEQAVARQDIDGALMHYDRALRVSDAAKPVLFPVLSSAITDPDIARVTAQYLRADVPWANAFINFAMRAGEEGASNVARLLARVKPAQIAHLDASIAPWLLARLVKMDDIDGARQILPRILTANGNSASAVGMAPVDFLPAIGPFAWTTGSDSDSYAEVTVGKGDTRNILVFAAARRSGTPLTRTLLLSPGTYRLDFQSQIEERNPSSSARWIMTCPDDEARPPLDTDVLVSRSRVGFVIPPGCNHQKLVLRAFGGDGPSDLLIALKNIAIQTPD